MIAYSEIEDESMKLGVPPETIEKDYHLDWYLAALWIERLFPQFLFYGGTAIKKLYVSNHRFSEDIDLISGERLALESVSRALDQAHAFLEKEANLFYSCRREEISVLGTQTRFVIDYRGFSQIGGIKRFLVDFAQGIEGLPEAVTKELITGYRDLKERKIPIRALPLEVICADKLALIVDRKRREPRDIYDLWSALMQVKSFNRDLFLSRCRKILSDSPEFSIVRSSIKNLDFKNAWEVRLKYQVPHLPDFELVAIELIEKLEEIWRQS